VDFCAEGGMIDQSGRDLSLMRAPIEPIRRALAAARRAGLMIVHTREGYAPDLSDNPAMRRARQVLTGKATGDTGPLGRFLVRGEPCWEIIPELRPSPGETIIDKPGYGAFHRTDLDERLKRRGIRRLVLTGVTTDCCVASTLREAEDRGYECLVLEDCCAAPNAAAHRAAIDFVKERRIFGTMAPAAAFARALESIPAARPAAE
ncbi:MAG: cysteine hydrolase family protein, partial [Alphaproteobacteria bacterium]